MEFAINKAIGLAMKFNDLVSKRVQLHLNSDDSIIKIKGSTKLTKEQRIVELTSHGCYILLDDKNYSEGIDNKDITPSNIGSVIVGDCDYTYMIFDIDSIEYIREAKPEEIGAIKIK